MRTLETQQTPTFGTPASSISRSSTASHPKPGPQFCFKSNSQAMVGVEDSKLRHESCLPANSNHEPQTKSRPVAALSVDKGPVLNGKKDMHSIADSVQ